MKDRKGKEKGEEGRKGRGGGTFIANQTNGIKKDSIAKTIKHALKLYAKIYLYKSLCHVAVG